MIAEGAFIQLGSFLLNSKTSMTEAAIFKSTQEYKSNKKIT
jgi:hypothetical protein